MGSFFFIKLFDLLLGGFFVVIAVFHFRELFSEQLRQEEGKEKKKERTIIPHWGVKINSSTYCRHFTV